MIADEQSAVRDVLRMMLDGEPDIEVVGQARARRALGQYADTLWDAVRTISPFSEPSTRDPYNSVAALRDLTFALYGNAVAAMRETEVKADPDDEHPDPDVWAQSWTFVRNDALRYSLPKRGQPKSS
ncbi:hypothetical protein [Nonomuraea dietziae]|uniref:hypothetical protein n=1 Tax=Nonomuraea dietziae TaxID=65515 RepID=UPI0033EF65B8